MDYKKELESMIFDILSSEAIERDYFEFCAFENYDPMEYDAPHIYATAYNMQEHLMNLKNKERI